MSAGRPAGPTAPAFVDGAARHHEGPGMDHDLYPFSPIDRRPPLDWPGDGRIAFWVCLYLEAWELDPPADAYRDPRLVNELGSFFPDYVAWSRREYANRVGIFRLLDVLDRHGVRATVAANAAAVERYPYLVEECRRRGYAFAAHGTHATRMITSRMSEAEERAHIDAAIAAVARAAGSRPTGWVGQDYGESPRTPRLLAEAGLTHVVDWPNDDQPYRMTVGRPFVSIPNQMEWDDLNLVHFRRLPLPRYPEIVEEAFAGLWAEGGRVFGLGLHPWVIGQAARIRYLDEALGRILRYRDVWRATAGEIAEWALQKLPL